jgi:hypothetical protein
MMIGVLMACQIATYGWCVKRRLTPYAEELFQEGSVVQPIRSAELRHCRAELGHGKFGAAATPDERKSSLKYGQTWWGRLTAIGKQNRRSSRLEK